MRPEPSATMPRRALWALSLLALACAGLLAVPPPARAYIEMPPPGSTGGFGEGTCRDCHSTYALNEGRTSGIGDLIVTGLPETWEPGRTYRVTVDVNHTEGRQAWGFQLTARQKDGSQAGDLKPVDDKTVVLGQNDVLYIEQSGAGSYFKEFAFDWVAPAAGAGEIIVNVAGNAADGDLDFPGDYIYTRSVTIPMASH